MMLTFCRNSSRKPDFRGFFSLRGTVGAVTAAAAGNEGRLIGCFVGCLPTDDAMVGADVDVG